jgi:hypothetical protein
VALFNAAVRNHVSPIALLRAVAARASARRSEPMRPVVPSVVLVGHLPAAPGPPPDVTSPVAPVPTPSERREQPGASPGTPPARRPPETAARTTAPTRADALARILALNRRAETAYRDGEFAEASRLLRTALALSAAKKLGGEAQSARTHALLAAVLVKGYRQNEAAIGEFRRALLVPRFSPSPSLLDNQRVLDVYEQAVASLQPAD